jgi:hypothetical protein
MTYVNDIDELCDKGDVCHTCDTHVHGTQKVKMQKNAKNMSIRELNRCDTIAGIIVHVST